MKKTLFRLITLLILVSAMCAALVSCGGSSPADPGKTPKTSEEAEDGLKVLSKDEFKALFTPVEIKSDNVLDYFEITSDDKGYWLSPKENVLSVIARDFAEPGFYCELTYVGKYEVSYTDENGNVIETETIEQTMTTTSLYSDRNRIQLSPLVLKHIANAVTYEAPVKSITDITLTKINQTPYSVCVASDLTPHYNDMDGEKVVLVTEKFEGAVVSPTAIGYTASGKTTSPILMEEKNGKLFMLSDRIDFSPISEEDFKRFGGFAWFKTLIESGYFER